MRTLAAVVLVTVALFACAHASYQVQLDQSTLLGGAAGSLTEFGSVVESADGRMWAVGSTNANTMALEGTPLQATYGGDSRDCIIAAYDADGVLVYSTFWGGAGKELECFGAWHAGQLWLAATTSSDNLAVSVDAVQDEYPGGDFAAYVAAFDADATTSELTLAYATYFGGDLSERVAGVRVANQDVHVFGAIGPNPSGGVSAGGNDTFPTTSDAAQTGYNGGEEGFYVRFDKDGVLEYATLLGGANGDSVADVQLNPNLNVVLVGETASPAFLGSAKTGGDKDAFVVELSRTSGQVLHGPWVAGGSAEDAAHALAIDGANGHVYVSAHTASNDVTTVGDAWQTVYGGAQDALFAHLDASLDAIMVSYLGLGGSHKEVGGPIGYDGTNDKLYWAIEEEGGTTGLPTTGFGGLLHIPVTYGVPATQQHVYFAGFDATNYTQVFGDRVLQGRAHSMSASGSRFALASEGTSAPLISGSAPVGGIEYGIAQVFDARTDATCNSNGVCEAAETCASCQADCGACPIPDAPGTPTSTGAVSANTIQIQWDEPTELNGATLASYVVQYVAADAQENCDFSSGVATQTIAYSSGTVTDTLSAGILANTLYCIRVYGVTQFNEETAPSEAVQILTDVGQTVPDAPFFVTDDVVEYPTRVFLKWSAPTDDGGSAILNYIVQRATGNPPTAAFVSVGTFAANVFEHEDNNLAPDTWYTYRIYAENSIGRSSPSAGMPVQTELPAPPERPVAPAVPVGGQEETTLRFSWAAPLDNGAPITVYKAQLWDEGASEEPESNTYLQEKEVLPPTDDSVAPSVVFDQLLRNKRYAFRVIAVNAEGESTPSAFVVAATKAGDLDTSGTDFDEMAVALLWIFTVICAVAAGIFFFVHSKSDNPYYIWAAYGFVCTGVLAAIVAIGFSVNASE